MQLPGIRLYFAVRGFVPVTGAYSVARGSTTNISCWPSHKRSADLLPAAMLQNSLRSPQVLGLMRAQDLAGAATPPLVSRCSSVGAPNKLAHLQAAVP